MKAFNITPAI